MEKHDRMKHAVYDIKEIIDFLGIHNEWNVADLGVGDGFFQGNLQWWPRRSLHTILTKNILTGRG